MAKTAIADIIIPADFERIHNDAQPWSVNHLAKVIAGDDPMQTILDLVADYWARADEGLVVSTSDRPGTPSEAVGCRRQGLWQQHGGVWELFSTTGAISN
jgi:hypothetical protein